MHVRIALEHAALHVEALALGVSQSLKMVVEWAGRGRNLRGTTRGQPSPTTFHLLATFVTDPTIQAARAMAIPRPMTQPRVAASGKGAIQPPITAWVQHC